MSANKYIRTRDRASVGDNEALNPDGTVRDGYYVGFALAFMDSAPTTVTLTDSIRSNLTDAERTFADSAEGQHAVALHRQKFELSQAYRGGSARVWTDAMAAQAIRQEMLVRANRQQQLDRMNAERPALEAAQATARAMHDAALQARR